MEAFVSQAAPSNGDSEFDKILASIDAGIKVFRAGGDPVPAPIPAATTANNDLFVLVVIAVGIYFLL
jgi:hypothetical protein